MYVEFVCIFYFLYVFYVYWTLRLSYISESACFYVVSFIMILFWDKVGIEQRDVCEMCLATVALRLKINLTDMLTRATCRSMLPICTESDIWTAGVRIAAGRTVWLQTGFGLVRLIKHLGNGWTFLLKCLFKDFPWGLDVSLPCIF
jgi:hypothetical protein